MSPPGLSPRVQSIGDKQRALQQGLADKEKRHILGPGPGRPVGEGDAAPPGGGERPGGARRSARTAKDPIRPAEEVITSMPSGGGTMPLAADQHRGVGPAAPPRRPQPDHDHGMCGLGRAGARTPGGGAEGMRRPGDHAERPRAMVLSGRMRDRRRLRARSRISRGGQSTDQRGRRRGGAGEAMIRKGPRAPWEVGPQERLASTIPSPARPSPSWPPPRRGQWRRVRVASRPAAPSARRAPLACLAAWHVSDGSCGGW